MGLFGNLLGSSKSTVVQTATNTTNVDVGVELQNIIEMGGIEKVLQQLAVIFSAQVDAQGASTQATLQGAVTLADAFKGAAEQQSQQQQSLQEKVVPLARLIGYALVVWLGVKIWKEWK